MKSEIAKLQKGKIANSFPKFFAKIFLPQFSTLSKKEVMERIEAPTLIIHSRYDKSVSYEHAEYAAENIKNSEISSDDFWGHLIWLGRGKEKRDKKILDFLR